MQIKRTAIAALAVAALVAPAASASPAVDPVAGPAPAVTTVADPGTSSRFKDELLQREIFGHRRLTPDVPTTPLVEPRGDGFDWTIGLIAGGAAVLLTLVGLLARGVIGRRRKGAPAVA